MSNEQKSDSQFDVIDGGPYPDTFDKNDPGRWFVATASNTPIGVVWTNDAKGFGFIPMADDSSAFVADAREAFKVLSQVGGREKLDATVVYEAAKQLEGYSMEDERRGKLKGALDALEAVGVTAAAAPGAAATTETAVDVTALPEATTGVLPEGDSLCATVDEEGNILELIYSNREGIYIRDGGEWTLADTENEDQPTIDDQEWLDVNPAFIEVYDDLMQTSDSISREDAVPYASTPA